MESWLLEDLSTKNPTDQLCFPWLGCIHRTSVVFVRFSCYFGGWVNQFHSFFNVFVFFQNVCVLVLFQSNIKRTKFLRNESMRISILLQQLQQSIRWMTWTSSPYWGFMVWEPWSRKEPFPPPPKKKKHHQIHAELWTFEYIQKEI